MKFNRTHAWVQRVLVVSAGAILLALGYVWLFRGQEPVHRGHPFIPEAKFRDATVQHEPDPFGEANNTREPATPESIAALTRASTIRVRSNTGSVIPRASVWLLAPAAMRLGETDALGVFESRLPEAGAFVLAATAQGHVTASLSYEAEPPAEVEFELEVESEITGVVTWSDGHESAVGCSVAAWVDGYRPDRAAFEQVRRGVPVPNLVMATTAEAGAFTLRGLSARSRYTLTAATIGGLVLHEAQGNAPGGGSARLELAPVFAGIVQLQEVNQRPLRAGSKVYGRGPGWFQVAEEGEAETIIGIPSACFLILDSDLSSLSPTTMPVQMVLLSAPSRSQLLDGVVYEVEVPGYDPVWSSLRIPPLSGRPKTFTLFLSPNAAEWGTLHVRVEGPSLEIQPDGAGKLLGLLQLVDENGRLVGTPIPKPVGRTVVVEGIPYGRYQARLRLLDGSGYLPAEDRTAPVTIGKDVAQLVLDATTRGCMLVRLNHTGGQSYEGAAVIRLYGPQGTTYVTFDEAPYALEALAPGTYTVYLDSIPGRADLGTAKASVTVDPGSVATPAIQLPF